ncbi:hypothetical protein ATANTOWER_023855 [Ataeniobius toweri]|uniref:Uncharacterized protein n=1 Tax=Ataeniobius toweri TaxID=208326 RepID=A0ABU7A300_9TELE|nr:hypothetical protein [Ataeniobius toweri]
MSVRRATFAPSKAAVSYQAAIQPREMETGVLAAWQHMLKGSEVPGGSMLLSVVLELSVKPGHQAVISSVCSPQIINCSLLQTFSIIYWAFYTQTEMGYFSALFCY